MHYRIAWLIISHELEIHHLLAIFTIMPGGPVGRIVRDLPLPFVVASYKFRIAGTNSPVREQRADV